VDRDQVNDRVWLEGAAESHIQSACSGGGFETFTIVENAAAGEDSPTGLAASSLQSARCGGRPRFAFGKLQVVANSGARDIAAFAGRGRG